MTLFTNFFESTLAAPDHDALYGLYRNAVAHFGFDIVVHSFITDHHSINRKIGDVYFGPVRPGWYEHYLEKKYRAIDPIRASVFKRPGARVWNELLKEEQLCDAQKLFIHEVNDAGLRNGVTVPIYGLRGEIAAVSVSSTAGVIQHTPYLLSALQSLSMQLHSVSVAMSSNDKPAEISLTAREHEIMKWVADGKSNKVIAAILAISENSVKFHLKNIFCKLDASSRQSAVIKAIKAGIIRL